MADDARTNGLILECIISGLAESCQNIRLSRLMKQVLYKLYDAFTEYEAHALCLSAFPREGKRRLRQDAFLSRLQPLMIGREEFACTARWSSHQRVLDEMMACCSAIWLKEEGRELGVIERLGDFLDLPEKNDSTVVPGAMQERRSQVLASILQDPLADYSPPGRQAAPARLTDIPFVQNATDVACFITRAFKRRNVRVEFLAEVVPDFYRVRSMDNGLRPQRYLAGITAILAETLPDGALLLVDVEPDRFVFDCRALGGNCYLTERTFCVGDGNGQLTVDSDLLMACYTLWADHDLTLNPLAFSVPVAAAESVRRKITAERLHQVRRLFQAKPELRWKALADDKLDAVARIAARTNASDDLVWVSLPTLNEEVRLVSMPAVFRTLNEPNEGKELRKVFH